mgnify:CR=1 FL=1
MQASDIRANGLVGRAGGGAGRDRDPMGATPHWRRRRRRQRMIDHLPYLIHRAAHVTHYFAILTEIPVRQESPSSILRHIPPPPGR